MAGSSRSPYEYRPLETTTTIRLIQVCEERVEGCIACIIHHVDLEKDNTIEYCALSYVWGDPKPTGQVYLQDQDSDLHPLPLHENLLLFLEHLWRNKRFLELYWTDRLCLDQNSHEEISQQVPRMCDIYRSAEFVVAWLQLNYKEQFAIGGMFEPRGDSRNPLWKRFDQDIKENPYWERVWIVQEVVVAKKVILIVGDVVIGLNERRAPLQASGEAEARPLSLLYDMRAAGGKIPLWKILIDFSDYQSSRPADRVYGMLGMVANHDDGSSPVENIRVDYNKPASHVMLDAMFESLPPLARYDQMAVCLRPRSLENCDMASLLEDYMTSDTATQRHKEFAKIALHTLEALDIMRSVSGIPRPEDWRGLIRTLLISAAPPDWEPTSPQSAALIGLVLANHDEHALQQRKGRRQRRSGASSPWRCAAHQCHNGSEAGLGSYDKIAEVTTDTPLINRPGSLISSGPWDSKVIVEACGQKSPSCDESTMTCEIPQIELRLVVEGVARIEKSIDWGVKTCLSFQRVTLSLEGVRSWQQQAEP